MAARKTAAALVQLSTFRLGSASTTPWFGSRQTRPLCAQMAVAQPRSSQAIFRARGPPPALPSRPTVAHTT